VASSNSYRNIFKHFKQHNIGVREMNRREFLKKGLGVGVGLTLVASVSGAYVFSKRDPLESYINSAMDYDQAREEYFQQFDVKRDAYVPLKAVNFNLKYVKDTTGKGYTVEQIKEKVLKALSDEKRIVTAIAGHEVVGKVIVEPVLVKREEANKIKALKIEYPTLLREVVELKDGDYVLAVIAYAAVRVDGKRTTIPIDLQKIADTYTTTKRIVSQKDFPDNYDEVWYLIPNTQKNISIKANRDSIEIGVTLTSNLYEVFLPERDTQKYYDEGKVYTVRNHATRVKGRVELTIKDGEVQAVQKSPEVNNVVVMTQEEMDKQVIAGMAISAVIGVGGAIMGYEAAKEKYKG
jgi:hypothetical protein